MMLLHSEVDNVADDRAPAFRSLTAMERHLLKQEIVNLVVKKAGFLLWLGAHFLEALDGIWSKN